MESNCTCKWKTQDTNCPVHGKGGNMKSGMETGDLTSYHYKVVELQRRVKELEDAIKKHQNIQQMNSTVMHDDMDWFDEELYEVLEG